MGGSIRLLKYNASGPVLELCTGQSREHDTSGVNFKIQTET